jgi:endoribonuclease Dicer
VWKFALSEVEARKLERKAERMLDNVNLAKIPELEAEIEKIRKAKEFIESYEFVEPKFTAEDTSSKVLLLKKFLDKTYRESEAEKCIIFVQRRWTAKCLYELFKDSVSPHLKLGILVGSRTGMTGEDNFTFRQQMLSVSRFRRGKLNCLIATSVAEEGLDIPDCSMVVRFDLYTTMIQYIQSRGRARQSNSKYFHMIEQGNAKHLKILKDVRNAEEVMRNFCQSLPDDRLLDNLHATHKVDDNTGEVYIEPTTGAKLTFSSAMMVVAHYVGTLVSSGKPTKIEITV